MRVRSWALRDKSGSPARLVDMQPAEQPEIVRFPAESVPMGEETRLAACLSRLAAGDLTALDPIYDAYATQIYGLALWRTASPDDAADVLQIVFVKLAERRGQLGAVQNPRAYILTMARRATVDLVRSRRRRPAISTEDVAFLEVATESSGKDSAVTPEESIDARNASRLLSELPDAQREAVYLRHFADLTFAEIGRVTGVPTFTAASRYRLGIRRLRKQMQLDDAK